MAPYSGHAGSYESLVKNNNMKNHEETGSIGSDTFRAQRRRAYEEECETDEQLFSTHNITSIFDNRHHDVNMDDDLNSAGSSLGGYESLGDAGSKASVRTREELRLSLINRRRRLAQMENAMAEDASIDFSLRLNRKRNNEDASSLVSSLRDSMISLNDSIFFKKKKSSSKDKKKKSKKKSSSKDKEKERKKEKKSKKSKHKHKDKEKEKRLKSKKSDKKHRHEDESRRKDKQKKSKSRHKSDSSSESSSSSESEAEEDYSKYSKHTRQSNVNGHRSEKDNKVKSRTKALLASGGESIRNMKRGKQPSMTTHGTARSTSKGSVPYAPDEDTGMCVYHPTVQLRRKSRHGGWKDVFKQCPKCAAAVDHKRRGDRSGATNRVTRQSDRGMPRSGAAQSQRQPGRRNANDSGSSSSSSSGPSKKKGVSQQQQRQVNRRTDPRQQNGGRRPGDTRGASQPPRSEQRQASQRGASQPPKRGTQMASRGQSMRSSLNDRSTKQQSRGHQSYRDPPSSKEPPRSHSQARYMGRDAQGRSSQHQGANDPGFQSQRVRNDPPQRKVDRGRTEALEENEHPRSHSAVSGMVDFDPPNQAGDRQRRTQAYGSDGHTIPPVTNNCYTRHGETDFDESSQGIGSESDFALFRGGGGKLHNEEGMFGFFRENLDNTASYKEEKKMSSENQARANSYYNTGDNGNIQKMKSKTFHGMPPSTAPSERVQRRRASLTPKLEGISEKVLRNFILAESAHFDMPPENFEDLERALMDQVRRLSIGSGEGEVTEQDLRGSKFSVLREVVKSYMMQDIHHGGHEEKVDRRANSSPNQDSAAYSIGDEGRRRDMIKDDDKDVALMRIASLQPNDPAFIRRTTGKWTFAKVKNVASDSIVFFVNKNGSSKAYAVKYWVSHIRTLKAPGQNSAEEKVDRRGALKKQSSGGRFSIRNLQTSIDNHDGY